MTAKRAPRSKAELLGDADKPAPAKRGRPVEAHRVRLATAQAELAEIRAAKMRGELVPAAAVEAEWCSALADLRAALLALPARLGAKLALSREGVALADAEIRGMLSALAASSGVDGGDDD